MKIGLYFGTFNPIHVGHLIIANYMVEYTELDQVWLIVSPQNPLKKKSTLLADYHRYAMVEIAVEDNEKLIASNIEFKLPKPSYTINTLTYIKEKYPKHEFSLIMGEDNLRTFDKWKNFEEIISNHKIYVYPRALTEQERTELIESKTIEKNFASSKNIIACEAPVMKISASFIREAVKNKKDTRYLLTEGVYKYVQEMNFYKK